MNNKYKTLPCKYFPNCRKGTKCTYIHDENKITENENCEKQMFDLFVAEINNFIAIYKNKSYIKYKLSNEFWKKEFKYFQSLNEYLDNLEDD